MWSWCWLIFQWLHWQRGFRLNPLGSTWPAAFGWIILGTASKTARRAGALGACGLWGSVGEEQSGQWMLWRDVFSRGLQNPALNAVASSEEGHLLRLLCSEVISNAKPRTVPTVDGWGACPFPFYIVVHVHVFRFHDTLQCHFVSHFGQVIGSALGKNPGWMVGVRKDPVWL